MAVVETNLERLARERKEAENALALEKKEFSYDKLEVFSGIQKDLIAVLHKTVAKNTTPTELAYFLQVCKSSGLNPVNKEIWCYKDNQQNLIVFTGRDGFLKKNKENPLYRGMISSEVYEYDEFDIDMIEGKINHKITNNRGKRVLGAYAIVYIEGQKPVVVYLNFDEFNLGQAKWKTAPGMMIKKCAQSHALKEAAGITGIQAEESWSVGSNGNVTADVVHEEIKPEPEEGRLLKMIEACKSPEGLKMLEKECKSAATIEAFQNKFEELTK